MSKSAGQRLSAIAIAALALAAAAGCSSSPSPDRDTAAASKAPTAYSTNPGKGGPCRETLNHISQAGQKITADAKDRAKAAADLQQVADQFAADAEKIKNPEAKNAAKQLSTVYHGLAESAKNNQSPDLKTLPNQVQSSVAALSQCAATE